MRFFIGLLTFFLLLTPVGSAELYHDSSSGVAINVSRQGGELARPFAAVELMSVAVPGSVMTGLSVSLSSGRMYHYKPEVELCIDDKEQFACKLFDSLYQTKQQPFNNLLTGQPDTLQKCRAQADFELSPAVQAQLRQAQRVRLKFGFTDRPNIIYEVPAEMLAEWQRVLELTAKPLDTSDK